jgi:hypothetical protein
MVARLSSGGANGTPRREIGSEFTAPLPRPDREQPSSAHSTHLSIEAHRASAIGSAHSQALPGGSSAGHNDSANSGGEPPSSAARSHAFAASGSTKSLYPESYSADALPREVEGLDISTYANLKHAFEIIVHSYKLQKEALEANRRRWGDERQDLLTREQHLVEVILF